MRMQLVFGLMLPSTRGRTTMATKKAAKNSTKKSSAKKSGAKESSTPRKYSPSVGKDVEREM
jgi:hypothetical protein